MPDPSVHPYWLSTEARKLFAPKGSETVLEGIDAQIKILQEANEVCGHVGGRLALTMRTWVGPPPPSSARFYLTVSARRSGD